MDQEEAMKGSVRWWWVGAMVAMVALTAFPAEAQRPGPRGGGGPAWVDRAAAQALRLADELELTEEQRAELQGIRGEALTALETVERERLALRQELRARVREQEGLEERTLEDRRAFREDARARMDALRDRERELTAPLLERYQEVLDADQRLQLRERRLERGPRRNVRRGRMDRGRAGRWGGTPGFREQGGGPEGRGDPGRAGPRTRG